MFIGIGGCIYYATTSRGGGAGQGSTQFALKSQRQILMITIKTSLLRRLQTRTLPDEAPPIGKIQRFSKMAVTFEPLMGF